MSKTKSKKQDEKSSPITDISVRGFKSLADECHLEVRPLTILAGANSSGKSSLFQPILMMKQTLEENFDPGPLQINGVHVKFTSIEQFLSKSLKDAQEKSFSLSMASDDTSFRTIFKAGLNGIEIESVTYSKKNKSLFLYPGMKAREIYNQITNFFEDSIFKALNLERDLSFNWSIKRNKCFLLFEIKNDYIEDFAFKRPIIEIEFFKSLLLNLIHIPGVRGNPERTYNKTAIEDKYPGLFLEYIASIIYHWQQTKDERLKKLGRYLEILGLAKNIESHPLNEAQLEIQVSHVSKSKRPIEQELINIADVGFGISQVLPVLVALLTAKPGQMVILEQPEIHLHPKAQVALAKILTDAAKRGIRVMVETHSALLLLGIQTQAAEGHLPHNLVKLNWFERMTDGNSKVTSCDMDKDGAYGDWPEDFGEVIMQAESRYLEAS